MTQAARSFGPVANYLPHRPPMLLIDDIVEVTRDRVVCRATIHRDCVFAIDGEVHPSAMIEFVAQACAIHAGSASVREGAPPKMGLIISCREASFTVDSFAVGDELMVAATLDFGQNGLAAFTGTVTRGETLCATVQLSVVDADLAETELAGDLVG